MGCARPEPEREELAVHASTSATDLKRQSTAISNGIGSMHREHYGRGADRIRTTIHPELAVTVLEDCFTPVEKTMVSEGAFGQVRETRTMFQDWMRPKFVEIVEKATGRKVRAFFSQVGHDPDMAIEVFLFEPPPSSSDGGPGVPESATKG
jgi:uncharacterized protein YbcI